MTSKNLNAPHLRLGVNIDHVATIRNARGGGHPDPVRAAHLAVEAGADGITAGPADGIAVSNNVIVGGSHGGISIRGDTTQDVGATGPITCTGNVIRDCTAGAGIQAQIEATPGFVIANNSIDHCERGIFVNNSDDGIAQDVVISGNNIRRSVIQGIWCRGRQSGDTQSNNLILTG